MKRAGQLMERIADLDNLRLAFWKAAKGKRGKADCLSFRACLEANLDMLRADLISGQAPVGDYHYFTVHDPKERLICAASFRERVLQHSLMNVCEPVLERAAIFDSYACRKGKGRLAAIWRAQGFARRHEWFLKLDVRKYFNSVDQEVLRGLLRRKFKDAAVLALFDRIIASYQTAPGRGLPIGNLTSQHFANYYLAPLDRFAKEALGRTAYVRYMDDFVIWGGSGRELRDVCGLVRKFLGADLKLELKSNVVINRTGLGMDFLGYRLFPRGLRLARRSKLRFARKFRRYESLYLAGAWTELDLQQRMTALLAFVLPAESGSLRRHIMSRFGVAAIGLEPCESRWQLEQQRQQLPGCEPEQQLAEQREQQHGLSVRAALSSTCVPDGAQADPVAILPCAAAKAQAKREKAPGVSRWDRSPVEPSGRLHFTL